MLRVGLTGGIGAGKSTVSARLGELGAVVIDADRLAREVVELGTEGLAAIVERFGADVLTAEGALDRPTLGRLVFSDAAARRDLEAITHPRIAARTGELIEAAPADAVVVHDVPLLVEKRMGPAYHLVLVVGAHETVRAERLTGLRGMSEEEAMARIGAQASDTERRAAADVWLDNSTSPERLLSTVDGLWQERLVPFEENVRLRRRATRVSLALHEPDPAWRSAGERLVARLRHVLGEDAVSVDHIGSTSVPELVAKDVVDLQVGVRSLEVADRSGFVTALEDAGFPRIGGIEEDRGKDGRPWPKRFHASADPGRAAHVHVRAVGSPGWEWALRFRDWLRADTEAREEYAAMKLGLAARLATTSEYAEAKEPWFDAAHPRLELWAERAGWRPASRTA